MFTIDKLANREMIALIKYIEMINLYFKKCFSVHLFLLTE